MRQGFKFVLATWKFAPRYLRRTLGISLAIYTCFVVIIVAVTMSALVHR